MITSVPFVRCLAASWCIAISASWAPALTPAVTSPTVVPVNDRDYVPAVRRLIQNARGRILISLYQAKYYAEYPDTASNRFLDDLIAARARGVEVGIVVDTGAWNPNEKNEANLAFVDMLTTSGVMVWEDDPDTVSHQKVICVDDDLTLVSSVNWTYYALAKNREVGAIVRDPATNAYFRRYFYERAAEGKPHANARPVVAADIDGLVRTPTTVTTATIAAFKSANTLPGEDARVAGNALPAKSITPLPNRLFYPKAHELILTAAKQVTVAQRSMNLASAPPGANGAAREVDSSVGARRKAEARKALPGEPAGAVNVLAWDLACAAKRGVKAKAILDSTEGMDDSANAETARWLTARGVEVFRESPAEQTHAKMMLVDDDKTVIGSTNWTRPAIEEGNEVSILIESPKVAAVYRDFAKDLEAAGGEKPYPAAGGTLWDQPAPKPKEKSTKP